MRSLFISDLHLHEGAPHVTLAFGKFLREEAADADALYVLGDLFEVWLGDDNSSAFIDGIKSAIAGVSCRKFLMHGNRDFLLGATFCEETGMVLLDEPTLADIDGGSYLLMHGDSLCTLDTAYQQARITLRDPVFQANFLDKPVAERAAFAQSLRKESAAHTRETAADIMDVTPSEVVRVMREAAATQLIHGHTHRPQVHNLNIDNVPATRTVLGDWDNTGWQFEIVDGAGQLMSFPIRNPA